MLPLGTPFRLTSATRSRVLFLAATSSGALFAAASAGALSAPAGTGALRLEPDLLALRPACYGSRPCSSVLLPPVPSSARLWLCDVEWRRPSGRRPSATLSTGAAARPFCPPFRDCALAALLSPTRSTLLAAAVFLVHRRPSAPFRLTSRDTTLLVAFLDVFGFPLLLVGVRRLVALWHGRDLPRGVKSGAIPEQS